MSAPTRVIIPEAPSGIPAKAMPHLNAISSPFLVQKDVVTLTLRAHTSIKLISGGVHHVYNTDADVDIVVSEALDTGSIEPGKDYYVYLCRNAGVWSWTVSLASTFPVASTADTSRKIGGFHTLCADVGDISGHPLSGYVVGDVLPASVWCLNHRPECSPEGMVWSEKAKIWVDIYMQSGVGENTASAYGATMTD
ncbi:MAG: hypothetical protein WC340_17905, partial [Kiritimatiellia bacterium]